ncbi:hypothetical protein EVAR_29737_1 [Eumeta japonica]|uniref:Uncharacterized protein n=1 Tax=Eumeta variegata TaxID=151549 RepID=A0A4C1W127_EUMVA|nr:hypothetical protein EVAR_29737_1 [Eumeta japonica]
MFKRDSSSTSVRDMNSELDRGQDQDLERNRLKKTIGISSSGLFYCGTNFQLKAKDSRKFGNASSEALRFPSPRTPPRLRPPPRLARRGAASSHPFH